MRTLAGIGAMILFGAACAVGQDAPKAEPGAPAVQAPAASAPAASRDLVAAPSGRVAEVPVAGMVRRDLATVALALPEKRIVKNVDEGKDLLLHDFSFDDSAVTTNKLHFKELAPGVMEITSIAYSVGTWSFLVRDAANYYGLGERFNALNHA